MPVIRGTYVEGERYGFLDIVALEGSSFAARRDDPGPCPGDGWQLVAGRGKPGKPGLKGDPGVKGERGATGQPAPRIASWRLDRENYSVTLILEGGTSLEPLSLRPLFEQYNEETLDGR
jgi:hypothetical protein